MEGPIHIVGLTGGIASGKSTVADMIAARGYPVVDADQVARDVVAPGEPALAALVEAFGEEILAENGTLDRRAVGRAVFGNDDARRKLESIVHPAIARRSAERFAELRGQGHPIAFYNAALLVETGSWRGMAALVVVAAPEEVQRDRLLARDPDLSLAEADARIASQTPLAKKIERADFVVHNDADLETLERRVDDVLARIEEHLDG